MTKNPDGSWRCSRDGCDLDITEHGMALAIEHIYNGTPTKSGRNFDAEESREVADRVRARLFGEDSA